MTEHTFLGITGVAERTLVRAVVSHVIDDHHIAVRLDNGREDGPVVAERLVTSSTPLPLFVGDSVLCWADSAQSARLLVIGRIGPSAITSAAPDTPEQPDTLVLEAKHALTLRVGDGSITIREDGKILIKGKDLVSHAERMNRIKGGAVSIN